MLPAHGSLHPLWNVTRVQPPTATSGFPTDVTPLTRGSNLSHHPSKIKRLYALPHPNMTGKKKKKRKKALPSVPKSPFGSLARSLSRLSYRVILSKPRINCTRYELKIKTCLAALRGRHIRTTKRQRFEGMSRWISFRKVSEHVLGGCRADSFA